MEEKTLRAYMRLLHLSKFPESKLGRLLVEYGSLVSTIAAAEESLIHGISKAEREALIELHSPSANSKTNETLERTFRWLEDQNHHLICFDSPDYPPLLKQIACPPPLLFVEGDPTIMKSACCAMVGSRKASPYGLRVAGWLANDLSRLGLTIVSGLALGIDSRSHKMALHLGRKTIAVLGTGVDVPYPKQNKSLKEEICETGAVISEYPLGTGPRPHHFPRRNRIISGISLGLIVVEAAERSGSLITARQAMEQGRDVFSVPGHIGTSQSKGCHRLIKDGANLIESAADVAEILLDGWRFENATQGNTREELFVSSQESVDSLSGRILTAITEPECLLESVAERAELSIVEVRCVLLELEVSGLVEVTAGRVSRCEREPAHHSERPCIP